MNASAPVILAAGGTGGHLFPAEAVADELLTRGHVLALVTDRRGAGFGGALARIDRHTIRAGSPSGDLHQMVGVLMNIAAGTLQARSLLKRLRPKAVVGFGGYPSLPTLIAAPRLKVPAAVHEQNALLGRVNRYASARVAAIALSFEATAGISSAQRHKVVVTGNPVRGAIAAARGIAYQRPGPSGDIRLLVTGGSQGATVFSEVVPEALKRLGPDLHARLRITQQCRPEDAERVAAFYRDEGIGANIAPFFDDLAERLAAAHLVICRAGASTVAELVTAGRPAILVPYPFARDDHQTLNAAILADAGAAWSMAQPDFTPGALVSRLGQLLAEPETLADAAARALRLGRPDAAARLVDLVERLARGAPVALERAS